MVTKQQLIKTGQIRKSEGMSSMKKQNILVIMVDQLNGTLFPDGPANWLHAPNLKKLASKSIRFENCYTASPLCAPGRASFMSGQLPSITGVYDNAAEFPSDLPTYAHHLRGAGYQTAVAGKIISSGQISCTVLKKGSLQTFTLLILAGHQTTVSLGSVLIGGITTWGLLLVLVLQRFPIKWSMMTKSPTKR